MVSTNGIVTDNLNARFGELKGAGTDRPTATAPLNPNGEVAKMLKSANAQVTTQGASHYHPLFEPSNLQLPTKLREINQWARYFFRSDPIVSSAVKLHSEFPITGFRNNCDDSYVQKYFDELTFDKLKLPKFLSFFSMEYQKLGNVFPMGMWDDSAGCWGRFITLNPDYVEVEQNLFAEQPVLRLDPDDALRKIVQTQKPRNLYDKLDPKIISYVNRGLKVPLSNFMIEVRGSDKQVDRVEVPQVTHVANSTSQYEAYGLPPFFSVFKVLMYKDVLRRAQFAIARRHWKPIKVVKVGDETHHASPQALTSVREAIDAASQDPESWLIWHNYINFDYIASNGHVMNLNGEYDWVNKELYAGLGVNEAILTGGGVTFANASVALRIMVSKYQRFQNTLGDWITENIYKPVARVQQFYKVDKATGKQELIYPKIEWEMMRLQDDAQQKTLLQKLQKEGLISKKTFLSYVGIDPEREKELVKKEREEDMLDKKDLQKKIKQETLKGPEGAEPKPGPMPGVGGPPPEGGGGDVIDLSSPPGEELPLGGGAPGEGAVEEAAPLGGGFPA